MLNKLRISTRIIYAGREFEIQEILKAANQNKKTDAE